MLTSNHTSEEQADLEIDSHDSESQSNVTAGDVSKVI